MDSGHCPAIRVGGLGREMSEASLEGSESGSPADNRGSKSRTRRPWPRPGVGVCEVRRRSARGQCGLRRLKEEAVGEGSEGQLR